MTKRIKKKKRRLELVKMLESMGEFEGFVMVNGKLLRFDNCVLSFVPNTEKYISIEMSALTRDGMKLLRGLE